MKRLSTYLHDALLLAPLIPVCADNAAVEISDRTVIFKHTSTNSNDTANTSGFNLGPSLALLPDDRVMAAWFSLPSEGAESQRIVQAFSSDQGRTWGEASVLQDFAGKADFDPSWFVAGTGPSAIPRSPNYPTALSSASGRRRKTRPASFTETFTRPASF